MRVYVCGLDKGPARCRAMLFCLDSGVIFCDPKQGCFPKISEDELSECPYRRSGFVVLDGDEEDLTIEEVEAIMKKTSKLTPSMKGEDGNESGKQFLESRAVLESAFFEYDNSVDGAGIYTDFEAGWNAREKAQGINRVFNMLDKDSK